MKRAEGESDMIAFRDCFEYHFSVRVTREENGQSRIALKDSIHTKDLVIIWGHLWSESDYH